MESVNVGDDECCVEHQKRAVISSVVPHRSVNDCSNPYSDDSVCGVRYKAVCERKRRKKRVGELDGKRDQRWPPLTSQVHEIDISQDRSWLESSWFDRCGC